MANPRARSSICCTLRPNLWLLLWGIAAFLDYSRLPIPERNLLANVPVLLLVITWIVDGVRRVPRLRGRTPVAGVT